MNCEWAVLAIDNGNIYDKQTTKQIKGHVGHVETQRLESQCKVHVTGFELCIRVAEAQHAHSELSVLVWWNDLVAPAGWLRQWIQPKLVGKVSLDIHHAAINGSESLQ